MVTLTNVPVEGVIVDSYVNGLFDGSGEIMFLPYLLCFISSNDVLFPVPGLAFTDRRRCRQMFFKPFIKSSSSFPNVFFITVQLLHLNQYITPLFCFIVSLSLDATKMFFNVLPL